MHHVFCKKTIKYIFDNQKFVKIFLDDILIDSENKEIHLNHLKVVLNTLCKFKASINFEKSAFLKESVKYLGGIINDNVIMADTSRVVEMKDIYKIKTKKTFSES